MRKLWAVLVCIALLVPASAFATEDLQKKIDALSKELDKLKQQMQEMQKKDAVKEERITRAEEKAEKAAEPSWLEIGGDYRFRVDSLKGKIVDHMAYTGGQIITSAGPGMGLFSAPQSGYTAKNDALFLNRFGLNLKARATEDVQVKARLLMYKAWGNSEPDQSPFFADRFVIMDGNLGHVPTDNTLLVDQAYATWSNIFDLPVWFSVGRRPSTGGVPTNIRQNTEKRGTAGVPGLLVDYAFDGLTAGVAPDIDALPGAYAKICYGRGMDTSFRPQNNRMKDVQFVGLNVVPYDTDNLHFEVQYQRGNSIFAYPGKSDPFGLGAENKNIGDISWWGGVVMGKLDDIGPGDLNLFATGAISKTHPNDKGYSAPFYCAGYDGDGDCSDAGESVGNAKFGLLYDDPAFGGEKKSRTGNAIYLGARYDIKPTGTKIGAEYNRGSRYWMAFTPAADDLWTSKLATRGEVYEAYLIQHLNKKPIAKRGDAFLRLGYQYYKFKYTGSGFWLGEPKKIDDLTASPTSMADFLGTQMLAPVKKAHDIYLTFDVTF